MAGRRARVCLIGLAVALTVAHCWRFRDFTVDDAAISYAYSQNFAHGDGLVAFAGGERVEGYSNFLWVLLVGLGVAVAGHVMLVGKILGLLFAVTITIGAGELLAALRRRRAALDALPALLCAAFLPLPYWSMSGLENPLFLSLTLWCAVLLVREADDAMRAPWSALAAAGVALTRPDGLVIAVAAAGAQLLSRQRLRRLPAWLALAATPIAAHLAWRYAYYAYPWPNTYYVKVAFPFRVRELVDARSPGWKYLFAFAARYRLATLVTLVPLSLLTRAARTRVVVLALAVAALFFPLYARGDWMSEGRFAVGALPLLFVLAADGIENAARLVTARAHRASAGLAAGVALAAALVVTIVPRALALSGERVHHYPVPVEYVALRARQYQKLARALGVARPSVADGDAGGNLLYAGMPLVDIGWLTDGTLSHWGRNPGFVREYIYAERRPTFLRLTGYWLGTHLQDEPEFADYVDGGSVSEGVFVARSAFTVDGIDTRRPLASLGDGVALVGADVSASEVRAWLLARVDHPDATLTLRTSGGDVVVVPGEGLYPPKRWRAGEVVALRARRPAGALQLCADDACVTLSDGKSGAAPIVLPAAPRADASALYARANRERAAGDTGAAFADYARTLAADPSRSFARRRLEELRPAPRAGYHPILALRLAAAVRAFQLAPDAAHLLLLARLGEAARDPLPALRAARATGLPLPDAAAHDAAPIDFERGRADGWSAHGEAFENPVRTQQWREQFGVQGNAYVTSKDFGRGTLASPPLRGDVAEVCLLATAGDGDGVELDGAAARVALPVRSGDIAAPACARVPAAGGPWRVVAVDGSDEAHVVVDDVTCFAADGAPVACAQ